MQICISLPNVAVFTLHGPILLDSYFLFTDTLVLAGVFVACPCGCRGDVEFMTS